MQFTAMKNSKDLLSRGTKKTDRMKSWFAICPRCGKEFALAPENVYKLNIDGSIQHMCSYTCFLREKEKLEAEKGKI